LHYYPTKLVPRLGDGFYEQKLIREQIAELTGKRFLDDSYTNDEDQYKALMNAGLYYASQFNLTPGVALTDAQMAMLTTDMVWMVEQEVTLPDGSKKKALVPQVYAAVASNSLDSSGNLLSAKAINLKATENIMNTGGNIAANNLKLSAENITNTAGRIEGQDVSLKATNDLQSIQGLIKANGTLNLQAGHDLTMVGGALQNTGKGATTLNAGNSIMLMAHERGSHVLQDPNAPFDPNNYTKSGTYDQTGATIDVGGSLSLSAG
jgi:filamentous hemagglutinin